MATLPEIMDLLAGQIGDVLCGTANPVIPDLQVDGRMIPSPTPPTIDIYPGDPFQQSVGFGVGNKEFFFTVRARVSTAENAGGQDLLLSMMDPRNESSVEQAILADPTLGTAAVVQTVEGPSSFGVFADPGMDSGNLLGCTWRVRVMPE